jgi:Uncharacterized protein conserved in bacteria (DUF2252)
MVRQVVGVGSVGMRVYLVLFEGRSGADPLFLQVKQAGPSVYETHAQPSRHASHGERVISGKRLIQSAADIFVGWGSLHGRSPRRGASGGIPTVDSPLPVGRLAVFALVPMGVGGAVGLLGDEAEVDRSPGGQPGGRGGDDLGLNLGDIARA